MNNPRYIDEAVSLVADLADELKTLRRCCNEALRDDWNRSDEGFVCMRDAITVKIQKVNRFLKIVKKG